ncbi:substrate-binding domain-containing protein [Muriicola sp. Z0-33]|uniref:LacI family DNA-binding transcriptional regulator n=1 Tax=Muriicola sp. Z0-33 TaxID=2816957 RepID=UPI002237ECC2|nr:substrate-binding domain-containing protein [Muriicola sp. Z0-33]MCW5517199.1 substrate-binding domain-containing protein [Muriicola sp. Z0-33]
MVKKKYTIKDIARLAGVSKGTVDRVLHKRGKVSQKAFEKVDAVLKKIDYHPNPIARNLKTNKVYNICVLLPDPEVDPYWDPAHEGILQAAEEFMPFGVIVEEFFYHPHNKSSFVAISKKALQSAPDALLMAPLFHDESLELFNKCRAKDIVIASFNNSIDPLHNENFIGQDLFQSGRVAASLIDKMIQGKEAKIGILHVNLEPHMQLKEDGFKSYFSDKELKQVKMITHIFRTDGAISFEEQLRQFLNSNRDLSAIFVTNSKAFLLTEVLQKELRNAVVVGYDLLKENIGFIEQGSIDFLIHQKPKRQAYLGVGQLAEHFLFGKSIPSKKLLPIDVITSENVQYYHS